MRARDRVAAPRKRPCRPTPNGSARDHGGSPEAVIYVTHVYQYGLSCLSVGPDLASATAGENARTGPARVTFVRRNRPEDGRLAGVTYPRTADLPFQLRSYTWIT